MNRGNTAFSLLGVVLIALCIAGDSYIKHRLWINPSLSLRADPLGGIVSLQPGEPTPRPAFIDGDAYYWLSYAQDVSSHKGWRTRHTHLDNAPYGRPVHWFSGLNWFLSGMASIVQHAGRIPLSQALEYAGLVSGPILAVLTLLILQAFLSSRLPRWAAIFFLLSIALLPVWRKEFSYGRVDHNGFVVGAVMGMLLCLCAGGMGYLCVQRKTLLPAARAAALRERRWFVAAGVFGGLGLWAQASFVFVVVLAVWTGLFSYSWFCIARRGHTFRTADMRCVLRPGLWRIWTFSGAATSLLFYLVEYFPNHMGMRLEVNHPLYALCWIGLVEALIQFTNHEMGAACNRWRGWAGLTAGLLLPALALWGPPEWFTLRDPVLLRVHTLIREFEPLRAVMPHSRWLWPLLLFGGFPLMIIPAAIAFRSSTSAAPRRLRMFVTLATAAMLLWATWNMNRMAGLCMATLVALGYTILDEASSQHKRQGVPHCPSLGLGSKGMATLLASVLAIFSLGAFGLDLRGAWTRLRTGDVGDEVCTRIILRDMALMAQRIIPESDRIVISGFNETPLLQYFGGFRGTGGLYWENLEGLRATFDFLAAYDDEDARRIAAERSLKGVIIWASDQKIDQFHFCKYGHSDPSSVRKSLAYRLAHGGPYPDWIGPVPFNTSPLAQGMQFMLFKILPERVALPAVTPAKAVEPGT